MNWVIERTELFTEFTESDMPIRFSTGAIHSAGERR